MSIWNEGNEQIEALAQLASEPFECVVCGVAVPDPADEEDNVLIFCKACRCLND